MIEITRQIPFDYGHRVLGHEGKCRHIHGHRGVAEITVSATELDSVGRIIDFGAVKEAVGDWINKNWDHNLLLHCKDPLLPILIQEERKPYVMSYGNPTAENMAVALYNICITLLSSRRIRVLKVRIYETPNCWADYVPQT